VILSTGKVADFTNASGATNQMASTTTDTTGVDGDADLNAIAGAPTFDGTITAVTEWNDPLGETSFSYEVTNQDGITDVGFVTGESVPCFVEGTRIKTAISPVPVKDVAVGDLVLTLDHGFQSVDWHGVRQVPWMGSIAPVRIPAGAFGDHGALAVSPQHRLLVSGWRSQLYAGEDRVPVKAIHLVRASSDAGSLRRARHPPSPLVRPTRDLPRRGAVERKPLPRPDNP
jgi:Hint domain